MTPNAHATPNNSPKDPVPDIPVWLMLASLILVLGLPVAGWYILSSAFSGLVFDLFVPFRNASETITVRSFDLAGPMYVLGLVAVTGVMGIVMLARPLKLPQSTCNRLFRPFGWLAIAGLVFALMAKPAAWGLSAYLEDAGYYQCEEHTRISPFSSTRVLVHEPDLCHEL